MAQSGAERRVYKRHPVYVPAQLSGSSFSSEPCIIRDFCSGGMFVSWGDRTEAGKALPIKAGDNLRLDLSLPDDNAGLSSYTVHIAVARVLDAGVGVSFTFVNPAVIDAFQRLVGPQAAGDSQASAKSGKADAEGIGGRVIDTFGAEVTGLTTDFMQEVEEALFRQARDAGSDSLQRSVFDCMNALKQEKEDVQHRIESCLASAMAHPGKPVEAPDQEAARDSFSLVDKDDFEEFLTIADIVASAEQDYASQLESIELRLAPLVDQPLDHSNNPIGPAVICNAVSRGFHPLRLEPRFLSLVYDVVRDFIFPKLGALYERIDATLEEWGLEKPASSAPMETADSTTQRAIDEQVAPPPPLLDEAPELGAMDESAAALPPLNEAPPAASVPPTAPVMQPRSVGAVPTAQAAPPGGGGFPALDAVPQDSEPAATPPSVAVAAPQGEVGAVPPGPAAGAPVAAAGMAPAAIPAAVAAPAVAASQQPAQLAAAASNLFSLRRAVGHAAGGMPVAPVTTGPTFSPQQVANAVRALESESFAAWASATQEQQFRAMLQARLESQGGEEGMGLGAREADLLDMVSGLMQSIREDGRIDAHLQPVMMQLATVLQRAALLDDSFLEDGNHPVRQFVDRVADLHSEAGDGEDPEATVEFAKAVVDQVRDEFEDDFAVFDRANQRIDAMLDRQQQAAADEVEKLIQDCERQQATVRERRSKESQHRPEVEREIPPEWALWLNRAKEVKVGDAMSVRQGSKPPVQARVAWIGDDFNPYVFVNHSGKKVASMTQQELAMHLRRGAAKRVDDSGTSLTDRAIVRTLFRAQDEIGEQVLSDGHTGLPNRQAMLAALEKTLGGGESGAGPHLFGLFQLLDGETVLRRAETATSEALRSKVAQTLESRLSGGVKIGALDEDTFCFLINGAGVNDEIERLNVELAFARKLKVRVQGERIPLRTRVLLREFFAGEGEPEAILESLEEYAEEHTATGDGKIEVVQVERDADGGAPDLNWTEFLAEHRDSEQVALWASPVKLLEDDSGTFATVATGTELESKWFSLPRFESAGDDLADDLRKLDQVLIQSMLRWMSANRDELDRLGGCVLALSAPSFQKPGILEYVIEQLTVTLVPPGRLGFAITAETAAASIDQVELFVRTLRDFGCRFVLDEFGPGSGAHSYLNNLPVDFLVVSGTFGISTQLDEANTAVLKSIVEIGRLTGRKVAVGGVEDHEVLAAVRDVGVEYAQGPAVADRAQLVDSDS